MNVIDFLVNKITKNGNPNPELCHIIYKYFPTYRKCLENIEIYTSTINLCDTVRKTARFEIFFLGSRWSTIGKTFEICEKYEHIQSFLERIEQGTTEQFQLNIPDNPDIKIRFGNVSLPIAKYFSEYFAYVPNSPELTKYTEQLLCRTPNYKPIKILIYECGLNPFFHVDLIERLRFVDVFYAHNIDVYSIRSQMNLDYYCNLLNEIRAGNLTKKDIEESFFEFWILELNFNVLSYIYFHHSNLFSKLSGNRCLELLIVYYFGGIDTVTITFSDIYLYLNKLKISELIDFYELIKNTDKNPILYILFVLSLQKNVFNCVHDKLKNDYLFEYFYSYREIFLNSNNSFAYLRFNLKSTLCSIYGYSIEEIDNKFGFYSLTDNGMHYIIANNHTIPKNSVSNKMFSKSIAFSSLTELLEYYQTGTTILESTDSSKYHEFNSLEELYDYYKTDCIEISLINIKDCELDFRTKLLLFINKYQVTLVNLYDYLLPHCNKIFFYRYLTQNHRTLDLGEDIGIRFDILDDLYELKMFFLIIRIVRHIYDIN